MSTPLGMRASSVMAAAVLFASIVAACGAPPATGSPSAAASPSPAGIPSEPASPSATPGTGAGSVGPFPEAGCPIDDPAFCAPASIVATAIVDGDAATIAGLSRPDVFRCDELDATIFVGCASADVLEGHPIGTAGGTIEVVEAAAYEAELDSIDAAIDPSFSDDAGTGEARVLGTSACGPDDPTRRSYYVAWTAAVRHESGDRQRIVGLYEFTFRDDAWLVGILYVGAVEAWAETTSDPLRDVGCGVTPWGVG